MNVKVEKHRKISQTKEMSPMSPYLIIFDIDETLYINETDHIPESAIKALDQLKDVGHTLAIATGRSFYSIRKREKFNNLPVDFYILANGQLVVKGEEVIYENAIEMDIINEVMTFANKQGIQLGFNTATHSFVTDLTEEVRQSFFANSTLPAVSTDIESNGPIYQMWYFSENYADLAELSKDRLRFIPWRTNSGADILPAGVSKAVALKEALKNFGDIIPEKTIFFGDGMNDIELMEMADIGVAMGNGVEALKEVADFVTKNIEDDGIYYACEQLGLFE